MKKGLCVLMCLCLFGSSYALCSSANENDTLKEKIKNSSLLNEDKRTKVTVNRQVYFIKRGILNDKFDKVRAEYAQVYTDEKMDAKTKEAKLKELENQILQINLEKKELKKQYKEDKKAIKDAE